MNIFYWIIFSALILALICTLVYILLFQSVAPATPNTSNPSADLKEAVIDTITISSDSVLGQYLVGPDKKTLYRFTSDSSGISNCYGQCAITWPPFYSDKVVVSDPLSLEDFLPIIRSDGNGQITYKGQPLYYYAGGNNAGDTNGQGLDGFWFIVNP
ncbi:MAG: hypothetical protein WC845_01125 [Candidatus Staskawiczbacteria bacterium]|jgi:predicted lipoprotein with Yx(FWY)xxD motif